MQHLSDLLAHATSQVAGTYFRVPIAAGLPTLRERVYCYELYHQLRCSWPAEEPYVLNGELDKAAHPILRNLGVGKRKPDLLVHRPGDMHGNHAIVEVKCSAARVAGLRKDIETLARFRSYVGYQRAILLIFGEASERAVEKAIGVALLQEALPAIEIWSHSSVGVPATHAHTVGDDSNL